MEGFVDGGKKKMKILIAICLILIGLIAGALIVYKVIVKPTFTQIRKVREESQKHLDLYLLMNDWVHVKQKGIGVFKYFEDRDYHRIAIYGMNYVGKTLVSELENTSVEVIAGIDKNAKSISGNIRVLTPDEFDENVDVIVVTPIAFFESIADMLEEKVTCPVVSIEDVIFEVDEP